MNEFEKIVSGATFCGDLYLMPNVKAIAKGKLIIDGDYTIFYDAGGCKTIVKKTDDDTYDVEKAACYAVLKSLGIKPSVINKLVMNAQDNTAKREKRLAKKAKAKIERQEKEDNNV